MSASSLFSFTLKGMSISPGTQVTFAGHVSELYSAPGRPNTRDTFKTSVVDGNGLSDTDTCTIVVQPKGW